MILNNGVHESVGSMPTAGYHVKFTEVALASGYKWAKEVRNEEELVEAVNEMK